MLYDVTYKIAPLHIFNEMFEIIKIFSFLGIIYYQGVKDEMTGHNYLQIFYIFLIHLLFLWNQSKFLKNVQQSYRV